MAIQGPYPGQNVQESIETLAAGNRIRDVLHAKATLDFPSIATFANADLTITVSGARANDIVHVGPPTGLESALLVTAYVSANDTVTVRLGNMSGGAVDPASGVYRVTIDKFDVGV